MEPTDLARAALHDGDPAAALDHLRGADSDDVWWLRALASARLADALRVAVALRHLPAAPEHAAADVGPAYAAALLTDDPSLPAWRTVASWLATSLGLPDPGDAHLLAWDVVSAAADRRDDDDPVRARCVMWLGALAHHLGRPGPGTELLRAAQETARRAGDAAAFFAATEALRAAHTDDAEIVAGITRHGARVLRDLGAPHLAARLAA